MMQVFPDRCVEGLMDAISTEQVLRNGPNGNGVIHVELRDLDRGKRRRR